MEWLIGLGLAALLIFGWREQIRAPKRRAAKEAEAKAAERSRLEKKYVGSPFLQDILAGSIRQGMTREQVIDAWGPPAALDERVFKTKVVHTLKYGPSGRSFRHQVKIENGFVVGWTRK